MKNFLVVISALTAASAFADASVYHFTYSTRIPATSASCTEEAQELASRIQAVLPKAKSVIGQCVSRSSFMDQDTVFTVDQLSVGYVSESRLPLTVTSIPMNDGFTTMPAYASYKECVADLADQAKLYQEATGLAPLSASCDPSDEIIGVTMKIEAAGSPARTLKTFSNLTFLTFDDDASWRDEVLVYMANAGALPIKTTENKIAYYADRDTSFSSRSWAETESKEQCDAQMAEASGMMTKLSSSHALMHCHFDKLSQLYSLDTVFEGAFYAYFDSNYHQETFFSYDECMAVRQSVLDRGDEAKSWLGSFCTVSEGSRHSYVLKIVTSI